MAADVVKSPVLSFEDRLWTNIAIRSKGECWNWKAGVGGHGYGLIQNGKIKEAAHRAVWRIANGPIPKIGFGHHGGVIRHTCNNRLCCNPDHLVLGRQSDNVSDMCKRGNHAKGNAKLSDDQIDAIRRDPRSSRKIAPEYGVCDAQIRSIRNGRCWSHL